MWVARTGIISSSRSYSSLLLDTYSGASAAYSLRKLRTAYTGNSIRVRRLSDNASLDIGFLNNNLDTATLLTFIGSSQGLVSIFYDQSGNSNDLIQNTGGNQPIIVSSGGILVNVNGKPSIYFNGNNSTIVGSSSVITNNFGVFSVAKSVSGKDGLLFAQYSQFDANRTLFSIEDSTNQVVGFQAGSYIGKTGTITNNQKIYYYNRNGSSAEISDNNSTPQTGTNSTSLQNSPIRLGSFVSGSTTYTEQYIQEIVIYNSSKSTDKNGIITNINSHYNTF